ncbi:4-(cytidine 5'-diphospho)-2-C-methyl-D-erythritol kinase [Carboxylicivirga mesophila]|uniref:4-diphosphocytidyl-2-C-methyl-D-erythritol kinase n=1 Tax=Carboxylicivirga mesophila TaxID=1166478 RepID=A0ABS5KCQ4_9BACT|nr:4-(cytidine 5'-diphospho)-2-C-methyl-D-erythritol kinase [Carboxylicivirga mesophila]MBS2212834.1 4-(cytidine 5'-diphospho)-2-C-methyl-D-erythritol kinase [Carboxylicivirga mesophila]
MICYPNAKINIGLNVVEKRPDGYHNLETVFFPIPLSDALEAVRNTESSEQYQFSSSGIEVDAAPEDNICIKAYELLRARYELPALKIHLHKMIPFGAGLGGGSADGAFMLNLLNKEFNLNAKEEELLELAAHLGADCAFFIKNKPSYATGIGNILQDVELDLSDYYIALIKPPIHVSTPDAYRGIIPTPSSHSLTDLIQLPVEQWKHHIKNDFEQSVFAKYPEIGKIKMELYEAGASYACMSGSGSSVFGLFKTEPSLNMPPSYFTWIKKL